MYPYQRIYKRFLHNKGGAGTLPLFLFIVFLYILSIKNNTIVNHSNLTNFAKRNNTKNEQQSKS